MGEEQLSTAATSAGPSLAGKYLTCMLGTEFYGLGILKVQEIIGVMAVTSVPRTPPHVRGVINLRGKVIPVVDLRLRFGLERKEDTDRTCIVVVRNIRAGATVTTGVVVDEVSEVLDIAGGQIEPPPSFGGSIETDFILGMGKVGQKVVMLLDVDRILSTAEMESQVGVPELVA